MPSASKLYGDAGMEEKSNACIAQATKLAERIRKLAYDPESGFFADSYYNGKRSGRCSFQTNLIALYSGVAKPSSFEAFSFKFLGDKQELLPLSNTKFFAFVLETLFAFKQQYFAIELIREAYRYNRKLEEESAALSSLLAQGQGNGRALREILNADAHGQRRRARKALALRRQCKGQPYRHPLRDVM